LLILLSLTTRRQPGTDDTEGNIASIRVGYYDHLTTPRPPNGKKTLLLKAVVRNRRGERVFEHGRRLFEGDTVLRRI